MKTLVPVLLVALAACSQEAPAAGPSDAALSPTAPVKTEHGFDVHLTLTPRAADRLAAMGEQVTVAAYYFGEPRPGATENEGEHMGVSLGEQRVDAPPANAVVVVTGKDFDAARLPEIEGAPQVLVNVFSARKAHADNLIDCGIYQGPVAMVRDAPADIRCDLLEPVAPR